MRHDRWQFGIYKVATVFGISPDEVRKLSVDEFARRVAFIDVDTKPKKTQRSPPRR